MTTETPKQEQSEAGRRAASDVEPLVMRAEALLGLLNSDFGMSGGVAVEAIKVELEAAYMDGLREGIKDFARIRKERDHYRDLVMKYESDD